MLHEPCSNTKGVAEWKGQLFPATGKRVLSIQVPQLKGWIIVHALHAIVLQLDPTGPLTMQVGMYALKTKSLVNLLLAMHWWHRSTVSKHTVVVAPTAMQLCHDPCTPPAMDEPSAHMFPLRLVAWVPPHLPAPAPTLQLHVEASTQPSLVAHSQCLAKVAPCSLEALWFLATSCMVVTILA